MDIFRVGLIIPHTDTTLEYDLKRELPSHYSIHTERMWLDDVTIESEKAMIEQELPRAIKYLKEITPDVAVFGCTSAGAIYGVEGDEKIKKDISNKLNCHVVSAYSAVHRHLKDLGSKKLALLTPYVESVTERVAEGLEKSGLQIAFSGGMGIVDDTEIGKLTTTEIMEFVEGHREKIIKADTLFISCTNLRALECKDMLESTLGLKVVTSNDAIVKEIVV